MSASQQSPKQARPDSPVTTVNGATGKQNPATPTSGSSNLAKSIIAAPVDLASNLVASKVSAESSIGAHTFKCTIPLLARVVFSCFSNASYKQRVTIDVGETNERIVFEGSGENVPMKCTSHVHGDHQHNYKRLFYAQKDRSCSVKFEHIKPTDRGVPSPSRIARVDYKAIEIGGPILRTTSVNAVEVDGGNDDANDTQLKIDFLIDHPNNPIQIRIPPRSRVLVSCMANSASKQRLKWNIEGEKVEGTFLGKGQDTPMTLEGGNKTYFELSPKSRERWLTGIFMYLASDGEWKPAKVKPAITIGNENDGFVATTVNSEGDGKRDFDDAVLRVMAMGIDMADFE